MVSTWSVKVAEGEAEVALGRPLPDYAEWVRLLVGRALAPARRGPSARHFEYLVTGVPLEELADSRDPEAFGRARAALAADLEVLVASLEAHRKRLSHEPRSADDRLGYLRVYAVIGNLTLPEDLKLWIVTDEGLAITHWGLRGPGSKAFLDWSADELRDRIRQLGDRIGQAAEKGRVASVPTGSPRDGSAESAAQRRIVDKAHDPTESTPPGKSGGSATGGSAARPPQAEGSSARRVRLWDHIRHDKSIAAVLVSVAMVFLMLGVVGGIFLGRTLREPHEAKDVGPAKSGVSGVDKDATGALEKGGRSTEGTAAPKRDESSPPTPSDESAAESDRGRDRGGDVPNPGPSESGGAGASKEDPKQEAPRQGDPSEAAPSGRTLRGTSSIPDLRIGADSRANFAWVHGRRPLPELHLASPMSPRSSGAPDGWASGIARLDSRHRCEFDDRRAPSQPRAAVTIAPLAGGLAARVPETASPARPEGGRPGRVSVEIIFLQEVFA